MIYIIFLLTLALLIVLGLVSTAKGAGPAALKPVQDVLKPVAEPLSAAAGTMGIIAVIWGVWGIITFVVFIQTLGSNTLSALIGLLTNLVLITVGVLAGYPSVAAFFGAPASGAGKFVDWFKSTFAPNEAIVGIVTLVLALWELIEFILNRSGVYI
ncbi:MAG: hypothetical protein IT548_14420 [Alphaproteobacteria bacterium]|nr:hypothetical protein [Alphaproteobacteria bacterium]